MKWLIVFLFLISSLQQVGCALDGQPDPKTVVSEEIIDVWPNPKTVVSQDVLWFEATNEWLVMCWGDGKIASVNLQNNKAEAQFICKDFSPYHDDIFVSFTPKPLLAIVNQEGRITVYDILANKVVWCQCIEGVEYLIGNGFSDDGKKLYCVDSGEILCLEAQTGDILWKMGAYYSKNTIDEVWFSKQDKYFVQRDCIKHKFIIFARDPEGNLKWLNSDFLFDRLVFTGRCPKLIYASAWIAQPAGASDIILFEGWTHNPKEIAALSVTKGEILWTKQMSSNEELWAVNIDKTKLAFYNDGKITIEDMLGENKVAVEGAFESEFEGAITPAGEYLLLAPKLKSIKVDYDKEKHYVGRSANDFRVIDCKTGKTVKILRLKKQFSLFGPEVKCQVIE